MTRRLATLLRVAAPSLAVAALGMAGATPRLDEAAARSAHAALLEGRIAEVRVLAEAAVERDPEAAPAHCLLARILLRHEGDAAGALRRARACRAASAPEARPPARGSAAAFWHRDALLLGYAASEGTGRHAAALAWLDALEHYHPGLLDGLRAWPLMKLGRISDARQAARRAIDANRNATQVAKAATALCALEARAGALAAAYEACTIALERGPNPDDLGARLVNLAGAARTLGRRDERERLLLRASEHFSTRTIAAPWLELTALYTDQGRFGEALGAWRAALDWQARWPAALDVHSRAAHARASALFLLSIGRPDAALARAERALWLPDRTFEVSVDDRQVRLGQALVARRALLERAERARERLACGPWPGRPRAAFDWLVARLRAWQQSRAIVARLDPEALERRVAPYAASELDVPEWLELDLVAIAGPGVAHAAVERAGRDDGYSDAWRVEIASARGDLRGVREHARRARSRLPGDEAMLRARVAAHALRAAAAAGDWSAALQHAEEVLRLDPGAVRRAGAALPLRVDVVDDAGARALASRLVSSPRFVASARGLRVALRDGREGPQACLRSPSAELRCAAAADAVPVLLERWLAPDPGPAAAEPGALDGVTALDHWRSRAAVDALVERLLEPAP